MAGKLSATISKKLSSTLTIEIVSFKILIEAYNLALSQKEFSLDWDEEQISQYLVDVMKKSELRVKHQLVIGLERKLNDSLQLPLGVNHPKRLPRIDINIVSWSFSKDIEQEYFFEAKNLCENNWIKKNGSKVSSSYYQKRYIDTGIENFRKGRYFDGSIIAYVLQGNTTNIISKINNRLYKDTNTIENIQILKLIPIFQDIYKSIHVTPLGDNLDIKHIFLKF